MKHSEYSAKYTSDTDDRDGYESNAHVELEGHTVFDVKCHKSSHTIHQTVGASSDFNYGKVSKKDEDNPTVVIHARHEESWCESDTMSGFIA
jgi:hypothetical protein